MRKLLLTFMVILGLAVSAMAQNRTVTGQVLDEKSNPVEGVSVTTENNVSGTSTDKNGRFTINAGAGSSLIFSSVNYATVTKKLGSGNTVSVVLTGTTSDMDEVVVVAYGTVKKGEATSSVAQISADEIKNRPLTNVTSALEGAAPGIQVLSANGQPGSGQTIRLRGFGSINASNDPLFVVDGVPYTGAISNINMDDVESITALKDAGSTALYGSRAGNGVVIITTKRGKKNRSNLQAKASYGMISRGIKEYERVGVNDYYPLIWQAVRNGLAYASTTTPTAAQLATASQTASNTIKSILGYNPYNLPNDQIVSTAGGLNPNAELLYPDDLDWSKQIIRTGIRQEYSVNYSGGNDKSDYFGSFGYLKENGFSIKSDLRKFTGRLGVNTNPVKWFKTGINISGTMSQANTAQDGTSTAYINPFNFIRNIGPIYPVYAHNVTTGDYLLNANGQRFYDYGNLSALGIPNRPAGASPGRHIAEETNLNVNIFDRDIISARTYGTILFSKHLDFTTNVSVDRTTLNSSVYANRIIGDAAPNGRASRELDQIKSYTFNQLLSYKNSFGKHNVTALVGHENYDFEYNETGATRTGQIFDGNIELGNFAIGGNSYSYVSNYRIESYLSRLTYDFNSKYFVTGSLRRDGNSRFNSEVREEDFWSVGLGWRVDQEKFMQNIKPISYMKLRSSYGKLGNDAGIGYYPSQALYSLGYNNATEPGVVQTNLLNDSLTWETSKNFDAAIEFGLFKNRINASVEYYKRITTGLIFSVPQPISGGGTTTGGYEIFKNIGELYNKGYEVHVDGDVIRNKNLSWNIGVNLSTVENEITKMPTGQPEIINGSKKLSVGHSIYDYWLRDWQGVDSLDGAGLFRAANGLAAGSRIRGAGDTVTTNQNNAKFNYIGSAIPDFFGSITTSLNYKGFEFNAIMSYQVGGKIYDGIYAGLMDGGASTGYGGAQHIDALSAWKKPGDITSVPRMDNTKGGIYNAASSRWLIDASYFNIRSIGFAYNFGAVDLANLRVAGMRFYVNGENMGLFAKRQGLNPQQSFTGVTSNGYPPSRVVTMGLNVNF